MNLLWITHRRQNELSSKSRSGISNALTTRGWKIQFMSPDGDFRVERSAKIGRGHRSFTRSVSSNLSNMALDLFNVAIVEWTAVEGSAVALKEAGVPWVIMDRSPPVSVGIVGWIQRKQYKRAWDIARKNSAGRAVKSAYMAASQDWELSSAIVPAGVDCSAFQTASMNEDALIVYHGSLDRSRELHRLTSMGLNLLLFGEGNDFQRLSRLTRVESSGDVEARLASADIGVLHLPNRDVWRHASPLKVAEFAAAGLPVVASEVSGLEPFRDAEWLTLIPLGDDEACKVALVALCDLSREERLRLGALAQEDAKNHMSWEHCTASLHEMLIEVKR